MQRGQWNKCTLSFPDPDVEAAWQMFFNATRAKKARRGLMFVCVAYMLYVSTQALGNDQAAKLVALRALYLLTSLAVFLFSFVYPLAFEQHVQALTFWLTLFTGINIVLESVIMRVVYRFVFPLLCINLWCSPFIAIVIIVFLVSCNVLIRIRFLYSTIIGWSVLIVSHKTLTQTPDPNTSHTHACSCTMCFVVRSFCTVTLRSRKTATTLSAGLCGTTWHSPSSLLSS